MDLKLADRPIPAPKGHVQPGAAQLTDSLDPGAKTSTVL